MTSRILLFLTLVGTAAQAQKPTIVYKPPSSEENDRPVIISVVAGAQGTDYAFNVEFDKMPWGVDCKNHCANATLFLDTDNNRETGLKLADPKAAETGADMVVTIQGTRALSSGQLKPVLRVKLLGFSEKSSSVSDAHLLAELDPVIDAERVLPMDNSVYLLVDGNLGALPVGKQLRVIYHPAGSPALVGLARGLAAPEAGRVEVFKDGKLTNPIKKVKKKSDYEKF